MSILDDLKAIEAEAEEGLRNAGSLDALEQIRIAVTGKKGSLTAAMKMMGKLAPEERPAVGKLANQVRANVEAAIAKRKLELEKAVLAARINAEAADVTLPGRYLSQGTQHLISQIREEIEDIFVGLGYTVEDGPYVETTWYNFTALNAPEDHPSRSAKDTFYVVDNAPEGKESHVLGESDVLLRTQTSGVQVHVMENRKPPIYMICPGTVFRPDTAPRHALPSALLPVHRAQLRGGRLLRRLRGQGLPVLQQHGLDRDPGLRHGRPQRLPLLRHRPGELHRLRLRHRRGARRGAALRPARPAHAHDRRHALPPSVLIPRASRKREHHARFI